MRSTIVLLLAISLTAETLAHPHTIHSRRHHRRSRSRCKPSSTSEPGTSPIANMAMEVGANSENKTSLPGLALWTPQQDDSAAAPADQGAGGGGRGGGWGGWGGKGGWGGGEAVGGGEGGGGDYGGSPSQPAAESAPPVMTDQAAVPAYGPSQGDGAGGSGSGGWGGGGGGWNPGGGSGGDYAAPQETSCSSCVEIPSSAYGPPGETGVGAMPTDVPYSAPTTSAPASPPVYSTNYIDVTETVTLPWESSVAPPAEESNAAQPTWASAPASSEYQTPPVEAPPASASYEAPASPTYQAPPVETQAAAPTYAPPAYSSFSTSTAYSSADVYQSNGQQYSTSNWGSSWTNTWVSTASTTAEAPVQTQPIADDSAKQFVDCHNEWRMQYGAPNVSWAGELADYANTHASICASMTHTGGPYGENLAAGTTGWLTVLSAIQGWMDEASGYNPSAPTFSHFTQVVWKETNSIGCAAIECPDGTGLSGQLYVMCEYHPRGNMEGAYDQNVGGKAY
ncbi:hypothetical protein IAU59_003228 [Kwoniella sp. CBS 9459]